MSGLPLSVRGIDGNKVAKVAGDGGDLVIAQYIALGAKGFTHLAAKAGAVDQLHLALTLGFFLLLSTQI